MRIQTQIPRFTHLCLPGIIMFRIIWLRARLELVEPSLLSILKFFELVALPEWKDGNNPVAAAAAAEEVVIINCSLLLEIWEKSWNAGLTLWKFVLNTWFCRQNKCFLSSYNYAKISLVQYSWWIMVTIVSCTVRMTWERRLHFEFLLIYFEWMTSVVLISIEILDWILDWRDAMCDALI